MLPFHLLCTSLSFFFMLECLSARICFFSRHLRLRMPLAAMKLHKGTTLSWMISITIATPVLASCLPSPPSRSATSTSLIVTSTYAAPLHPFHRHQRRLRLPPPCLRRRLRSTPHLCRLGPLPRRHLVICPFIDYILQNIMKMPVDLLSIDDAGADSTRRRSRSRDQVFSGPKLMISFISL